MALNFAYFVWANQRKYFENSTNNGKKRMQK